MTSRLTLSALGERLARPQRSLRNRLMAHRARLGGRPVLAATLPEPVRFGDAARGEALIAGSWRVLDRSLDLHEDGIWAIPVADPRLEVERQSFIWLEDLAALGNRAARSLAQDWVTDWIRRYGHGRGAGWTPALAGRRLQAWTMHGRLLAEGLAPPAADALWRAFAAQQRYLAHTWLDAPEGMPRLEAVAGLVWSGLAVPHPGHRLAITELGLAAEALVDLEGETPSRAPSDLADALILLIWTARMLENAGQSAAPAHLAAIVRGVPVLRPLRLGDGTLARFHGGSAGSAEAIDQALAELRIGVQAKPRLALGFARLQGGRSVVVMDAAVPPATAATTAHAATLAFEMSVARQPVVVNAGPGAGFGGAWATLSRQTAAQSAVEVDGRSSARIARGGLAARTFGPRLEGGPSLVGIRQAQDATGQWLLATHDGYGPSHGLILERRLFLDARGAELRGEDNLSVPDARARTLFDARATDGRLGFAVRFHLHPAVAAEADPERDLVRLTLPSGETWLFRASGGSVALEPSAHLEPRRNSQPVSAQQVVVRAEVVEYLGQVIWSLFRVSGPPRTLESDRPDPA